MPKEIAEPSPTAAASVGDPLPVRQRLRPAGDEVSKNEYDIENIALQWVTHKYYVISTILTCDLPTILTTI